jgi:hypothetical protein
MLSAAASTSGRWFFALWRLCAFFGCFLHHWCIVGIRMLDAFLFIQGGLDLIA